MTIPPIAPSGQSFPSGELNPVPTAWLVLPETFQTVEMLARTDRQVASILAKASGMMGDTNTYGLGGTNPQVVGIRVARNDYPNYGKSHTSWYEAVVVIDKSGGKIYYFFALGWNSGEAYPMLLGSVPSWKPGDGQLSKT